MSAASPHPCSRSPVAPGGRWRALIFGTLILSVAARGEVTPAAAPPEPSRQTLPVPQRGTLQVGVTRDSYPYCYVGPNGTTTGFTCDLLDAVARVMHLDFNRLDGPGREIQERFHQGEFDLLQALSQTEEREAYANFSVPYLTLQGVVFVNRQAGIHSLADLQGRTFAVIGRQSIGEQFLRDHDLNVTIVYVSSTEDALQLISAGNAAATFASNLTALSVIHRTQLQNIAPLGNPYPDYDIRHCFAVHAGDSHLLARLNEGLAILHRTGEFDQIYDHWFGQLTGPLISRARVVTYALWALGLAFLAAVGALLQQRRLHRRLARQAAQLSDQAALLQTLYDHIPSALCLLEQIPAGHRVLTLNRQAEAFFGCTVAEASGRLLTEFPSAAEWISKLAELLQHGATRHSVFRDECLFPSVKKRVVLTLVPIPHDASGRTLYCILAEDVTARRHLDNEIAQSRKLRAVGELVGGIAHEFNNLLTPILLKVNQIEMDWSHDAALLEETKLIGETVRRSAELTQKLLTFGRQTDQKSEVLHLPAVVSNCFSLMRLTMDRRIIWEQDLPASLPPLYLNGNDLNQIILNLIINARDTLLEKLGSQRGGWTPLIRVEARHLPANAIAHLDGTPSLRQIQGWQRLSVRDTGMGMPTEVRERVFEPFFTTKEVGKGTGLGLATVWHLVTAISGRVEIETELGVGTTFHVYLPMLPCPAGKVAQPAPKTLQDHAAQIFLAEDDQAVARAIKSTLQRYGYQVQHLADGAEAWTHLRAHPTAYDLLILDVNMPGLDGIELAQRVRALPEFKGRIMIASGRLSSNDLQEISTAKVDNVLRKPFEIAELLHAVRECLTPRG